MKTVTVACFYANETNCGDKSYVETILRLIDKEFGDRMAVVICDFYGRSPAKETTGNEIIPVPRDTLKNLLKHTIVYQLWKKWKKRKKYQKIREYYRERLNDTDALLIPGGGLVEYSSWRDYYYLMEILESICEERNIPVYINSIGYVANEDPSSWLVRWKGILNHPNVKHITCRDNLSFFQRLNPSITQVPCVASLSSAVFRVKKEDNSNKVGIGLMRPDAYSDYGNNISKEYLLEYYKQIVEELIRRGYQVYLFSVGVVRDQLFGEDLLHYMDRDDVVLCERPISVEMLLEQVASFRGILTVRTHSAYAAFSLNVPAVMIYFGQRGWSGKSREFMKMMGRPENAISCDALSPMALVEQFEKAMEMGWPSKLRGERMKQCYDNFHEITQKILEQPS